MAVKFGAVTPRMSGRIENLYYYVDSRWKVSLLLRRTTMIGLHQAIGIFAVASLQRVGLLVSGTRPRRYSTARLEKATEKARGGEKIVFSAFNNCMRTVCTRGDGIEWTR